MPEVFPRLSVLFFSGFGVLPYLLALLCARARLLPKGHRFFRSGEKFGIRHVLAEAALHIDFKWKNVDQIIVYGALLSGSAILFAFVAVVLSYLVFSTAEAAAWLPGIFQTAQPKHDVAFMMLDRVFGIPGIYDSEIITNPAVYGPSPNDFQKALMALFGFFSWGLFIIGVFIFLYFVIEIVWDITQEGKVLDAISDGSGGGEKGFAWLPLRFILALGLLVPINGGLNSAQYITLYVAKFGSGVATNAWGYFNMETGPNPMGMPNEELIAKIEPQDFTSVLKSLMIIKSCEQINIFNAVALTGSGYPVVQDGTYGSYEVRPYIINGSQHKDLKIDYLGPSGTEYKATPSGVATFNAADPFSQILLFSGGQGIQIVFGYTDPGDPTKYKEYPGGVLPVCGEVSIPVASMSVEGLLAAEAYFYAVIYLVEDIARNNGTLHKYEQDSFLATLREFHRTSSGYKRFLQMFSTPPLDCYYDIDKDGYESINEGAFIGDYLGKCTEPVPSKYWNDYLSVANVVFAEMPIAAARSYLVDDPFALYLGDTDRYIGDTAYSSLSMPNPMMMTVGMTELGWGGAGMWYTRIAERNGSFVSAAGGAPAVRKMPMVMEKIKAERAKNDSGIGKGFCNAYSPEKSGTTSSNISDERAQFIAEETIILHNLCKSLFENEHIKIRTAGSEQNMQPANAVEHAMASIFGQMKLFDIRENDKVLPMAQLAAVGKMLIDKSVLSMMAAVGSSMAGSALHIAAGSADGESIAALNLMGEAFGDAASAALTLATLGLTIGVVLHYVLPFLPFMYFFFAVARWVKTIFEAMVGVPLWALAHLRMSGAGLPGDAASSGYFLLLEIFVRPVITVVSLVGSFAVFTALVMGLNSIFVLLISNFAGADTTTANAEIVGNLRGIADQFFLSVMYVLLSYMIALSCFKLIDLIPDNIIRWSGAGVSSMGASDNADDLIDQLQYQMPMAVRYFAKDFGETITEGLYKPGQAVGVKAQREYEGIKHNIAEYVDQYGKISRSDAMARFGKDHPENVDAALEYLTKEGHLKRDGNDFLKTKK
ncbi:MAG TPA: DotA/TraY family protein [Alphaproteobacteria bacterium]|nr:DotA/TraY family protein [Alphaproteobacteria bacterium]